MQTITFYSYKGGVGRTLALANIASYLSKFGFSVCIMDFDLEAPGVHYKFPQITYKIRQGLVDYLFEYANNGTIPESLKEYSVSLIDESSNAGQVTIIPAGNVLVTDYWAKLSSVNWRDLLFERQGEGLLFFLDLKDRIIHEFQPDFLLIDSRTGVTEMSSLCTSVLPDTVVFLIANNKENIEGARQIYRGIKRFERQNSDKEINVTFALTRFPFLEDKVQENNRLQEIRAFLNEPLVNLSLPQLSIQDICVLHSDRDLELTETLRINQEKGLKETPLIKDYLKLFSRIIPEDIISDRLTDILNGITGNHLLLSDPDQVQRNLENISAVYRHHLTLEKLVDFYILRNEKREKTLDAFHDLFKIYGIDREDLIVKYTKYFLKNDGNSWVIPHFDLSIIERYLKLNPDDEGVKLRLADSYVSYGKLQTALRHYTEALNRAVEKQSILSKILRAMSKRLKEDERPIIDRILTDYNEIIKRDPVLQLLALQVLFRNGRKREVQELLADPELLRSFVKEDPALLGEILATVSGGQDLLRQMVEMITENDATSPSDLDSLYRLGRGFYEMGKEAEFKAVLPDTIFIKDMLTELERELERRRPQRRTRSVRL